MPTVAIPATPASQRNLLRVNVPFTEITFRFCSLPYHTRGADPAVRHGGTRQRVSSYSWIPARAGMPYRKTSPVCTPAAGRDPLQTGLLSGVCGSLRVETLLSYEVVYHGAGDAYPGRQSRQVICSVPAGVFDLAGLWVQISTHVICRKADHERVRERPRLAPEVPDVRDLDTYLLAHLADDGLLYGLPRLDETREHAVESFRESGRVRQQYPIPSPYEDNGRRAEAWKVHHPALCTPHRNLLRHPLCLTTTAPTEPVCRMPADDLLRPARHPEEVLVNLE